MSTQGLPPVPRPPVARTGLLTPGVLAFVVIDVVLVLVAVVMLTSALSGPKNGPSANVGAPAPSVTTAPPAPATAAPEDPAASPSPSAPAEQLTTFASPSRNILCEITADGARCTIANSTEKRPKDTGCPKKSTWGQVLTVTADGADKPCVDGPAPSAAPATTPVLNYDRSSSAHGYTCTSTTSGITCTHDATGRGFTLARAGSSTF